MRCSTALVGLIALSCASQAQAGLFIKLSITADVTNTFNYDPFPDPMMAPESQHLGLKSWTIQGFASDKIDLVSDVYLQPACTGCIDTTIAGNALEFTVDPAFVHTYGGTSFKLIFDHDLQGSLESATADSFVSGEFSSLASGGMMFSDYTGPVTGLGVTVLDAVPEPASWAMMIGGFAGIGGVLRTRRRSARAVSAR